MQPAQDRLGEDLRRLAFHPMRFPLVTNVDADFISDPEAARAALIRQVTGAVRWLEAMRRLMEAGVQSFVEVGPGKVLTGLMRQIDRSRACLQVDDEASLKKVQEALAANRSPVV
jgi:[acyl-carrier-protein] S-malonyltransferase